MAAIERMMCLCNFIMLSIIYSVSNNNWNAFLALRLTVLQPNPIVLQLQRVYIYLRPISGEFDDAKNIR